VVVSSKPDKTITVRIDVARRHRTYKKIVRSSSTLHAHDERTRPTRATRYAWSSPAAEPHEALAARRDLERAR